MLKIQSKSPMFLTVVVATLLVLSGCTKDKKQSNDRTLNMVIQAKIKGFDPIIADEKDIFRALEIAGYIGIMLAGAFPMVYLIKKYLARPMEAAGRGFGMDSVGAAGILAAVANIIAMFHLKPAMVVMKLVKTSFNSH